MWLPVLALALTVGASVAAAEKTLPGSAAGDIMALRDQAAQLASELTDVEREIEDTEQTRKNRVARDGAQTAVRAFPENDPRADRYRDELTYYEGMQKWDETNTPQVLTNRLKQLQAERVKKQKALRDNERQMYLVTLVEIDRQKFINHVSYIFGGLAAILIGGYFYLVQKDRTVMRSVFQSVAGLQMITLFSVVIAIILFGITGILEGKELSALLGGLTGYILGRVSDRESRPKAAQENGDGAPQ